MNGLPKLMCLFDRRDRVIIDRTEAGNGFSPSALIAQQAREERAASQRCQRLPVSLPNIFSHSRGRA